MRTEHTKGPWAVTGLTRVHGESASRKKVIYSPERKGVYIAYVGADCGVTSEDHANAHLIAAAPDLLAALEWIAENVGAGASMGGITEKFCEEAANVARDAISRAVPQ